MDKAWEAVQHAARPRIHTFIATSPFAMENVLRMEPAVVKQKAVEAVSYLKDIMGGRGDIQFSAEHFGDCRENLDFVIEVFQAVVEAGATTINLPNTVERYRPMVFVEMVEKVVKALPQEVTVAVHTHNDLGMATATTVESYFAGAVQMETALNGLGERAGNTNMYEVAMALHNCDVDVPLHLEQVYETALLVSKWADLPIPVKAPLIGDEAVAHRSGIHQDGASKTKNMRKGAYRPIDFSVIGRGSNDVITFTSQSGKTAVYEMLSNSGYKVSIDEAADLQPVLKELSEKEGELSEERVLEVFRKERVNVHGRLVFSSVNGIRDESSFVFRYKLDGEMKEQSIAAEGPIEACLILLREEGFPVELVQYKQGVVPASDAVWAGRALSEIELKLNGKSLIGRGVHNDTMVANMMALLSGVNLLIAE
jgi:2-isopropylmalate synthase